MVFNLEELFNILNSVSCHLNQKIAFSIVVLSIVVTIFLIFSYAIQLPTVPSETNVVTTVTSKVNEPTYTVMETDGQKHIIPLDKIRGGGPPKDGIPSIDNPVFAEVSDSNLMSDSDIVIGLEVNGEAKAYPLFILVWHEIVNDKVGGIPVSVTYCPLCYTSQVFERVINGQEIEFGTSGKLYNSNLLMYDRFTESYWSQSLGMAVTGPLSGYNLKTIPFDLITWGDWKKLHSDTLVLTTDTGHIRSYATDPYGNYYTEPRIMFPVENSDDRMHPKEIIIGFNQDGIYKAYKQEDIESNKVINDFVGLTPIMLISVHDQNSRIFQRTVDDQLLEFVYDNGMLIDSQTESMWTYNGMAISGPMAGTVLQRMPIHPGFWFEWVAFHPDTIVYGEP